MQYVLERLATPLRSSPEQPQSFDLETAVAAQIQRIVSARVLEQQNGEPSLLEFGMPNIVDLAQTSKSQLECYAARLAKLIMRYEPRLLHPSVTVEPTSNALMPFCLVVTGCLRPDADAQTFRFDLPVH